MDSEWYFYWKILYQNTYSINCTPPIRLLLLLLLLLLLRNCCTILALPIESVIMYGFWWFRYLNDRIDLPDMIGSFASGAAATMAAKIGTKKIIPLLWIESSPVDRFWCLRCLYDHIKVPHMTGSFASGTTSSLVAKNGTKKIFHYCGWNHHQWTDFMFEVSKQLSWQKYSHQAKLSRFGLAGLTLVAILDFQM